ncbi:hypothetical protein TNIN_433361 [Trichonephila inaurata madagascariensis]|uniref:Uncharacterized protein n=1 Tax=Trichonephila inaurata madagascariensis TaxID=2747483 RepID=A0A8X7C008_9ARAC|nr:hypothetical protein TNIN_433361 [Trichonephila inaurata madagascariensis]
MSGRTYALDVRLNLPQSNEVKCVIHDLEEVTIDFMKFIDYIDEKEIWNAVYTYVEKRDLRVSSVGCAKVRDEKCFPSRCLRTYMFTSVRHHMTSLAQLNHTPAHYNVDMQKVFHNMHPERCIVGNDVIN